MFLRCGQFRSAVPTTILINEMFYFYRLGFHLYRNLIVPFRRTPTKWSAIIFNRDRQVLVEYNENRSALPSGHVIPGYPIPYLCRQGLGLDESDFTAAAPLRLVGAIGTGFYGMTFYFSGEVTCASAVTDRSCNISLAWQTELESLVPAEIEHVLESR
jgi:hypothetical protein